MSELAEAHRVRTRTIESRPLYDDLDFDEPLIHTYTQTTQPRQVPAKALASASDASKGCGSSKASAIAVSSSTTRMRMAPSICEPACPGGGVRARPQGIRRA